MKLQKIRSLAQEIIHEIDSSEGKPFENFRIRIEGSQIICTWDANTTGEMDIEYYAEGINRPWQHSVRKYGHDLRIEDERFHISIGREAVWHVKAVAGAHDEEKTDSNIPEEDIEPKPIYFGYWDAHAAPDNQPANIYKLPWNDLGRDGKKIPMIGGFRHDDSESDIRKRLRDRKSHIDSASDVEFILLHDEPFYKNFTPEKQELIIRCAKEEMGDYKYGFSYARGALVDQPNADRRIPENLDVAMVNYYPFYQRDYIEKYEWWHMWITKEEEFRNDLENVLDKVKDVPEVYLTGQGHKDDGTNAPKYRQPPIESVQWYLNACYKYELKGVVWWLWESRSRAIGMGEMPELYEEHKRVFETIPK